MDRTKTINSLKRCDKAYYETGVSPLTDREYDDLKEYAKKEWPKDPYFTTIGMVVSNKVKLPYVLGSLLKYKTNDLNTLVKKFPDECCFSEKIDGMSVIVRWDKGKVTFAATRGDGTYGQDITEKMKIVCPRIPNNETFVLRGELVILGDKYKKSGYKNPRNGVVGIINRDSMDDLDLITPYFYEIIEPDLDIPEYLKFQMISGLGLNVPRYKLGLAKATVSVLNEWKINPVGYEIDGAVLSPNIYKREDVLYPEDKVAFKVNQDAVETTVDHVEWIGSRTGKLVPTVVMEPVEISGTTVKRATGFNAEFIRAQGIDKGAKIGIVKSGEIIPYIEYVYKSVEAVIPTNCPNCGSETKMVGVDLTCTNIDCSERVVGNTAHFLKVMGTETISETTLWNLGVKTVKDVYALEEEDIIEKEGFGFKRAEEIIFQLKKSLRTKPHTFIAALGMPMISVENAKTILNKHNINEIWTLKEDEVGLGPVASKSFVDNIGKYFPLYNFLITKGLKFQEEKESKIKGLLFTLTGDGNLPRPRYVKMIEDRGGSVKSISKKTNYLVCASTASTSGKMKKAKDYGTKIIMYHELDKMLED